MKLLRKLLNWLHCLMSGLQRLDFRRLEFRELSISRPRVAAILDASSAMTVSELLQLSALLDLEPGQLLAEAEARLKDDGSYQSVLLPAFDDDLPEGAEFVLAARRADPDSLEEREAAALDSLGEESQDL